MSNTPADPRDIEILIDAEDPDAFFTKVPNDQARAEGVFTGMTLAERGMHTALLSYRRRAPTGWRTSRDTINALAPELGRPTMTRILRGLEERHLLFRDRINDPDNRGRFVWRWRVFMTPRPDIAAGGTIGTSAVDGPTSQNTETPGGTIDTQGAHGPTSQNSVSAGGTIDTFTIDGGTIDGQGAHGHLLLREEVTNPPYVSNGGDPLSEEETTGDTPDDSDGPAAVAPVSPAPPGLDPDDPAVVTAKTVLRKVTTGLPADRMPSIEDKWRLVGLLVHYVRVGWTEAALTSTDRLGGDLTTAGSVYACLADRIRRLDPQPPPRPAHRDTTTPATCRTHRGTPINPTTGTCPACTIDAATGDIHHDTPAPGPTGTYRQARDALTAATPGHRRLPRGRGGPGSGRIFAATNGGELDNTT